MTEREKRITSNIPLVHACAKRFVNRGVEYDDLYQAGCVGLIKAVNGFDETRGFEFSTYAVPAILGEIKRIFRDSGTLKVSRSIKEKSRMVWSEKEKLSAVLCREPTVKELSEHLGMDTCRVSELLLAFQPVLSLTPTDDEEKAELDVPVENQEKIDDMICLKSCLSSLGAMDRKIIILRYFGSKTQSDVAREMGMSQVQVSRREKKILGEIKEKMRV
ncbi:MAG: sigma-70 family RNA polymerase sigma factor [Clostridia bacterium]|nr:sigma-70 family RNA polymerase sigma factor [Clostridia bacterium]